MNEPSPAASRIRVVRGAFRPRGVRWSPFVVEKTGSTNRLWRGSNGSGEWLLKWYRYPKAGVHPEAEISQFLQEHNFEGVAGFGGRLDLNGSQGWMTIAFVQRWLEGRSVWEKAVEAMRSGGTGHIFARDLGRSVGRLHRALGSGARGTSFGVDPWSAEAREAWTQRISESLMRLRGVCSSACPAGMSEGAWADAKRLCLAAIQQTEQRICELSTLKVAGDVIRIHGDLHLGQILEVSSATLKERYVVVDFEGEPMRSIEERRAKDSPLRDVAGMFRSFAYAAAVAGVSPQVAEVWNTEFLEGWNEYMPLPMGDWTGFVAGLVLEKALYEAEYEVRHRPDWLWIPLRALSNAL